MATGIAHTGRTGHIQKGGTKKLNVLNGEKMDIKEESSVTPEVWKPNATKLRKDRGSYEHDISEIS